MNELFPDPPAQRHSATSVAAAEEIKTTTGRLRHLVLNYLVSQGEDGATDEEGISSTGLSPSTYRPRRIELTQAGAVRDSGRTRKTIANRKAVVWVSAVVR